LTPEEISQLRGLIKPAVVLLLMLRLDRPVGAKEIASIFKPDQHTRQAFAAPDRASTWSPVLVIYQGYILLGGPVDPWRGPDVKNAHLPLLLLL
jgi:hypothetical protein